jgi:hypothetical protein
MTLENRYRILVLRLLAQILIKTHAGKVWGENENGVLRITNDADDLCKEIEKS